jgi:anti-sigma factor RsiW
MTTIDCTELAAMADDVALGLLTGEERAAALAHLEGCPGCRSDVASLAAVVDELVLLAPSVEPPVGFEDAVLARLAEEGRKVQAASNPTASVASPRADRARRRRTHVGGPGRRGLLRAVAAVAVVLALVGALLVGLGSAPAVATATMRTAGGDTVGEAYWRAGPRSTVVVDVPDWSEAVTAWGPTSDYALEVTTAGGSTRRFPLDVDRSPPWRVDLGADARVERVAIVDGDGTTWCAGRFESALSAGWPGR